MTEMEKQMEEYANVSNVIRGLLKRLNVPHGTDPEIEYAWRMVEKYNDLTDDMWKKIKPRYL